MTRTRPNRFVILGVTASVVASLSIRLTVSEDREIAGIPVAKTFGWPRNYATCPTAGSLKLLSMVGIPISKLYERYEVADADVVQQVEASHTQSKTRDFVAPIQSYQGFGKRVLINCARARAVASSPTFLLCGSAFLRF